MRRVVLLASLLAVVAACGGNGSDGDEGGGNIAADGSVATEAPPTTDCDASVDDMLGVVNDATFAIVAEVRPPGEDGSPGDPAYLLIGTAWAVRDQLLATNAHVTEAYRAFAEQGVQLTAALGVQSRTGSVVTLQQAATHPDYNGDPLGSPDVGLFTTAEVLPVTLPLAEAPDIRLGDEIFIVGFPGDVNNFIEIVPGFTVPQATSLSGRVTALRSHDLTEQVTTENLDVIQHQAPTTPGTSGSAMISCDEVVALNNAGTVQLVVSPAGEDDFTVERAAAAANNFAVHVRHLERLLDMFDGGSLASFPVPLPAAEVPVDPQPPQPEVLTVGMWLGRVDPGPAEHRFAFAIDESGAIVGLSEWATTGEFELSGQLLPDGMFRMVDNAPERLGYRRGIYEGRIDMMGNVVGVYFEETLEDQQYNFQGQRTE